VATVVLKLFLAAGADAAFFGQKDYQQVCVIKKMVGDLNVPVEIVMCPIIREEDGLAMSSRNRYLSGEERRKAVVLSQCLADAELMVAHYHVRSSSVICQMIQDKLQTAGLSADYVSIADPATLQEIEEIDTAAVLLLAARIGTTRLIDNTLLLYAT
jgi:pantoate--beta-alanine ligase